MPFTATRRGRRVWLGAGLAGFVVVALAAVLLLPGDPSCGCALPPPRRPPVDACAFLPTDLAKRLVSPGRVRPPAERDPVCLWKGRRESLRIEITPEAIGYQHASYPERMRRDREAHAVRTVPGVDGHTWTRTGDGRTVAAATGMARDYLVRVELSDGTSATAAERNVTTVLRAVLAKIEATVPVASPPPTRN